MKSQRDVSRRTFRFKMMVFMLTLAFPRETEGATFFHQHNEKENYTLNCSQLANKYNWYRGRGSVSTPSLLSFELIGRDPKEFCSAKFHSCYTSKTLHRPDGGIFACTPWTKKSSGPLFTVKNNCSNFDFFIVAARNHTAEAKAFGNISEQFELRVITEKDPLNLTCELQIMDNATEFALYWFKETAPAICLFSASNEGDTYSGKFSDDVNCCVDAAIKQRRTNHLVNFDRQRLSHNLTIVNASSSDRGTYLCVVAIWSSSKRIWTIARNVSVEVKNFTWSPESTDGKSVDDERGGSNNSPTNGLLISLGVIGGVILIGGIIGVLYWKKAAKGNPVKEHPRNQTEVEMEDDCSPYAVSTRQDLEKIETMYSVVTYPPETQRGASTLSDDKTASQSEEKVHTVYALVSK